MQERNPENSKLSKYISPKNYKTAIQSPWLWMLAGGLGFALVFLSGYSVRSALQTASLDQASDPAMAAATHGGTLSDITNSIQSKSGHTQSSAHGMSCLIQPVANSCMSPDGELCHDDLEVAKTAWQYFENNYNPETGLVNAVNNYPSTTMWDTGSALAATITASDLGLIDDREFDQRIMAMFKTLNSMQLFNDEAPNKVYNTNTMEMVDYANKKSEKGIGVSILDLARLVSWLNTLNCMHPQYHSMVNSTISRWDFTRLIKDGSMYGMARKGDEILVLQEGRLGYEQYAGKIFEHVGFDLPVAASYENEFRTNTEILGVPIAHDTRDPRQLGANNYVVTESYAMDAMESGIDDENRQLLRNIFDVQKKRWQETGIVTAISEDNIDKEPWFLYNSIFNAGLAWQTTNSSNTSYDHLKTTSVKAALTMALLFPEDEYSQVLSNAVRHAYDPEKGWYSGIYENGAGYNTALTANTNGIIMSTFLYRKYGSLLPRCDRCSKPLKIDSPLLIAENKEQDCKTCTIAQNQ